MQPATPTWLTILCFNIFFGFKIAHTSILSKDYAFKRPRPFRRFRPALQGVLTSLQLQSGQHLHR